MIQIKSSQQVRDEFRTLCRERGLFATGPRMAVLNHLLASGAHPSQTDIYRALRSRGIGRVTVIRTLKTLEDMGLVGRLADRSGRSHYEVVGLKRHHDHLVCLSCGRIEEVSWPRLERIQALVCRERGFVPVFHRNEVFGRCARCGGTEA